MVNITFSESKGDVIQILQDEYSVGAELFKYGNRWWFRLFDEFGNCKWSWQELLIVSDKLKELNND